MAGRGLSSEDFQDVRLRAKFISSMTVRIYCKCGDAVIVDGSAIGTQEAVYEFTDKHSKPGCEPCDSRTAARARAKRGREG